MKAVVLAAGRGTRLEPLTDDKPKPLVEVEGRPMLEHCFDALLHAGADGFVVVVGYKMEKIIERYDDEYRGVPITYAHQREQKGLAHALVQAEPHIDDGFLLMHGDNVFAPSAYDRLCSVASSDADAALLMETVSDDTARGTAVVVVDGERVVGVAERADDPPSNLGVVGFYALPTSVFEYCRRVKPSDRGEYELGDALSRLVRSHDVGVTRLDGGRVNVNTPDDLRRAEHLVRSDG